MRLLHEVVCLSLVPGQTHPDAAETGQVSAGEGDELGLRGHALVQSKGASI